MTGSIQGLGLVGSALSTATELAAKWPVIFTRGRTTPAGQALAMAKDIIKSGLGVGWIAKTYKPSFTRGACVAAVSDLTVPLTVENVCAALEMVLGQITDTDRVQLSLHFAGCAFDVARQPDEVWWQPMCDWLDFECRTAGGKLLLVEGGVPMCHAQFPLQPVNAVAVNDDGHAGPFCA